MTVDDIRLTPSEQSELEELLKTAADAADAARLTLLFKMKLMSGRTYHARLKSMSA